MTKNLVILSLGSNCGDRFANLVVAISLLRRKKAIYNISLSNIYETKALLPLNSPKDWDRDFLNMCIKAETDLSPEMLLKVIFAVQKTIGLSHKYIWGPRNIDIDIIFYNDLVLDNEDLTIPHKECLNRDFVLVPCCDIAADYIYPKAGKFFGMRIDQISNLKQTHNPSLVKNKIEDVIILDNLEKTLEPC